jgi:phage tail-like protein
MLKWFGTKSGMRAVIVILAVALVISIVTQLIGSNIGGLLSGTVVGVDREDPLVAFSFGLEVEGKLSGLFSSASGIGSENEVVYQQVTSSTGEKFVQANLGKLSWTPITLERAITSNMDIWAWRQLVIERGLADARANCSIIAYNQANEEIARWNLVNAWPSSVVGPVMGEDGTSYMVEQVILVHEGMERII